MNACDAGGDYLLKAKEDLNMKKIIFISDRLTG